MYKSRIFIIVYIYPIFDSRFGRSSYHFIEFVKKYAVNISLGFSYLSAD